jgi:acetamidase/formamidase
VPIHHFYPTHYHTTLGPHAPVLRIADGDTVITTTVDSRGYDARGMQVTRGTNPQTGPFYIEGATAGDTLAVHFDQLLPSRDTGFSRTIIEPHLIEPDFERIARDDPLARWHIEVEDGTATLRALATPPGSLSIPLAPMVGCFGVAPPDGQTIATTTSGPYGGNIDYRGFTAGVTVYLPVFLPGALFYIGDGHAAQGDGEIAGTGIETSFDVQFTIRLLKGQPIGWPRGENSDYIFSVGNARPMEQALQHATTEMCRWLRHDYGFDDYSLGVVLGQCVQYDVGNVVDPAYTIACKVAKRTLQDVMADRRTPAG